MITTRFSHEVSDDVAKGVDALIGDKFQAVLKELEDYKALFKRIAEKKKLIEDKTQETETSSDLQNGYIREFSAILDMIEKMFQEYVSSQADTDVELMLDENNLYPDVRKNLIRQQVKTYIFSLFYQKELQRDSAGDANKRANRLTEEILLIDSKNEPLVNKYLKKRAGTYGLSKEDYVYLIGLGKAVGQEQLTKIIHNNAGTFFTDLINARNFPALRNMIEKLRAKPMNELAGYELFFLTACTQRIIPCYKIFSATPSYDQIFDDLTEQKGAISSLDRELKELIDELNQKIANQPQTVILKAFQDVLVEAMTLYETEARILFKSFNNSWRAAQALLVALRENNFCERDKISLIVKFLQRQPEKHGLKRNSFDTFFLSAFYNKNNKQPFINTNSIYPQGNSVAAPAADIPSLLRGEKKLLKVTDRASIRHSTRLLLFKLRPILQNCVDETTTYLAQHTNQP